VTFACIDPAEPDTAHLLVGGVRCVRCGDFTASAPQIAW
jgi:hypothetical protein